MPFDKQAHLITFGCQMNEYDSGRLAEMLVSAGWLLTKNRDEADLIFFNTCSIREKAAQRVRNHLDQVRHLKDKNPRLVIAVGGCLAEHEGEELLAKTPWLDIVVGPQHLPKLPAALDKLEVAPGQMALLGEGSRPAWSRENLASLGYPVANKTAAPIIGGSLNGFVTIMQGCDNYCAYCVVPYLRGREHSREIEDIEAEVEKLIAEGAQDVTLLGQNVNSYGHDLPNAPTFPQLLKRLAGLPGLKRLRFTTSHPKDFSPELVALFGTLPPLCESLHLPVQSGSNRILQAMGRSYTKESYLKLVQDLRAQCPNLALTTDIIVGFPGETEKDFEETLELLESVGYDAMFSFKYSDRPGTKAINLPDKIGEEEKGRRLIELQTKQKKITLAKNAELVGRTLEVLVEKISSRYPGQLTGRARNFKIVHFDGPAELIGNFVPLTITEAWGASLRGEAAAGFRLRGGL